MTSEEQEKAHQEQLLKEHHIRKVGGADKKITPSIGELISAIQAPGGIKQAIQEARRRRDAMIFACDVKKCGGAWLAETREWIQRNKINGSNVVWGSGEVLNPLMTVADCEDLAAHIAARMLNDLLPRK